MNSRCEAFSLGYSGSSECRERLNVSLGSKIDLTEQDVRTFQHSNDSEEEVVLHDVFQHRRVVTKDWDTSSVGLARTRD